MWSIFTRHDYFSFGDKDEDEFTDEEETQNTYKKDKNILIYTSV